MSAPISPPPVFGSGRQELPAYLANGLVGLRVREMPLAAGMALLSGYTGEHYERQIEAAAVAPYPVAADLALDGVWLSDVPQQVGELEQAYDFSAGELTTRFSFQAAGRTAQVEVLTFCSRHDPTLVCQEIAVTVDKACSLGLRAIVDASGVDGKALRHARTTPAEETPATDGTLLWESAGALSTCGVAIVTALTGAGAGEQEPSRPPLRDHRLVTDYQVRARAGRTVRLRQMASIIPEAMHKMPDQHAARPAAKARKDGFDKIRKQNRAAWQELWQGRIRLEGAGERWQSLADAAFFYLNSSVHAASPASTSIFGLATWHDYHYYFGHVMWDIEAFAVPPLCLLQPDAAFSLLDYRSANLEGAKRNAQLWGRRGLQFPWESAPRSGEEAAPLPGTAAWHEDHVSLDVAWAFALYADITGDAEFLRTKAWPVLRGVAEWICSRVTKTRDGYAINDSMGIAEREEPVDNAAFTNMGAVVVLRAAIRAAERLGFAAAPAWLEIAEGMIIPKRGKAVISHDGYRANEEKGATPDPLMGIFPLGFPLSPAEEQATLELYLGSAQDYIGSPMLSALYGAWAARAGHRQLALKLLDDGYGQFLTGRFLQTLEYRADRFSEQPQAGPFFANIGGFLTGLLYGFAGLKPSSGTPESWAERPVTLPAGWTSIEIDRIWVRGQPMRLVARQGAERAELTPLSP
ncbi:MULTISPECIES: glycoside hydrolase family 65 protein [Rhodomicrobium]|uniref:glycoside hydrolase family 65 protein n=1 Tax=Rhodomicrobium TaxID=1068 RepID=UPI000B4BEFE8|nr:MULTISPECIES: glycoside hydrolase family 65 protein [Rhodomicrobium]